MTITFNSEKTIDRTIDSVAAQTHPAVEYLVIDGGSKDGTRDRLRARSDVIDVWISEPDNGISDAFNKGVAAAHGEYIAIVNSDDWLEPTHLANAVEQLRESGADFVYGDLMLHSPDGAPAYALIGDSEYGARVRHAMPQINHPTVVCRRAVYEKYGLFDPQCATAMDYDWLLRGYRIGVRGRYVPGLITHMAMDGVSDRNFARGLAEVRDISIRHGYSPLLARLRYAGRCAKTYTRRLVQSWIPAGAHEWLRRRVNSQYRSVKRGASTRD